MNHIYKAEPKKLNCLFQSIPDAEWARLLPNIEEIEMPLGQTLCEPGEKLSYIYFPSSAIVSLVHELENGTAAEVAVVGKEGLIGISIFMGGETSTTTATIKSAGYGYRIKSEILLKEFNASTSLMQLFLRFTQALITQITQTAVCNRHHLLEQQLCRLLLINLDRLPNNQLIMTQELIARLLGVRREGVTEAALKIQKAGFIKYARGHVTIIDRAGLEKRSCECYQVVKKEYERLLPSRMAA